MCGVCLYILIFCASNDDDIHDLTIELGIDLEQEDDADGFKGVNFEQYLKTGILNMKQTRLIRHVIDAVGRYDGMSKGKFMPSEAKPLVKDEYDEPASRMVS